MLGAGVGAVMNQRQGIQSGAAERVLSPFSLHTSEEAARTQVKPKPNRWNLRQRKTGLFKEAAGFIIAGLPDAYQRALVD